MNKEHAQPRRMHRQQGVMEKLRREIAEGLYAPGAQLPPERELAKHYGIARNTLRRLLDELADDGVLERHIGRGTFVRDGHPTAGPKTALGEDLPSRLRGASPADLMEVRLIIEPQVAALAASRASADDLAAIEQNLKNSVAAKGLAEFELWDARLHLSIFQAAKNALLLDYCAAINTVRNEPDWYRLKRRSLTPERRLRYDQEHSEIVAALRQRDAEAARKQLFRHLSGIRDTLLSLDA